MSRRNLELDTSSFIPHKQGESFIQAITEFLKTAFATLDRPPDSEHLNEYQQELCVLHSKAVSYLYATRKLRDRALAEGFEKHPKPAYNSEAQIALARQHATEEVRLHELVKDLCEHLKIRISCFQSIMRNRSLE